MKSAIELFSALGRRLADFGGDAPTQEVAERACRANGWFTPADVRRAAAAIAAGNLDYCDKLLQWCLPPRILLMGLVPLWTAAMTVFDPLGSIKWWIVLLLLLFALALALPDEQTDRQLGRALRRMPVLFLLTAANLFRLRGTKDKFIHTEHTGAGGNAPGANTPTEP